MEKETKRLYFIFTLIGSLAGGILLMVTDFGGYYWYSYDGPTEGWVWVYAEASVGGWFGFFAVASLLFFCSFVSLNIILSLEGKEMLKLEEEKLINWGTLFCYIVAAICVVGAITLAIFAYTEDVAWVDIWLDAGFYGGLIGSGLTAFLFKFYQYKLKMEK